jgi:hypothetical protein
MYVEMKVSGDPGGALLGLIACACAPQALYLGQATE